MASLTDHQWGMKRETTYGTPVTVDRFYPWVDGTKGEWDPRRRTAEGMIAGGGRRTKLASRSYLSQGIGKVTTKIELATRGCGVLLDCALGVSTVTGITSGSQQNFHYGLTGAYLPSATIQIVKIMNSGTPWVETYAGCTASKITIEQPEDAIATLEVEWDARSLSTVTAAAVASYGSLGTVLDATAHASAGLGATLTVPTTTALATGPTAFADIKELKVEIDQAIDVERWVLGGRNQPSALSPSIKVDGKAEFNASTLPAAMAAGTVLPFMVTWTTTETLGAGFAQAQLAIPQLALTGDFPEVSMGKTGTVPIKAEVLSDGTNRDLYWVMRTLDIAL